jgi:hypothetical protein
MKVSINCSPIGAAYGGGSGFIKNLSDYLLSKNHEVYYDLNCNDLDIILIIDPRNIKSFNNYSLSEIIRYLKFRNSQTIVIHRINECDERKNTKFMNKKLRVCNYLADHTVVISNYLKTLNIFYKKNNFISTIYNGSDNKIFNTIKRNKLSLKRFKPSVFNIVTHHWSPNYMKGHDIYFYLDELCGQRKWKGKIKFTYIGNLPNNLNYKNTKILKPLYGSKLSKRLQQNDIYITASNNDPGPSHHLEGALCGLPILYKKSGGIPETAKGYGLMFNNKYDFEKKLNELIDNYNNYKNKMSNFPYTKEKMCNDYLKLFKHILKNKKKYYTARKEKSNFYDDLKILLKIRVF